MSVEAQAIVFDLDGVLVDSGGVIERRWTQWAKRHQLDPEFVLQNVHGKRFTDGIATVAPWLDAKTEAERLAQEEAQDQDAFRPCEGAIALLNSLPNEVWAVATSSARRTAQLRLSRAGLPTPPVLTAADDVNYGKPAPDLYLMSAKCLDQRPDRCIAFEDTPAGVEAAQRAGMQTIAVTTTHAREQLSHATAVVPSLANLQLENDRFGLSLNILSAQGV